MSPGLPWYKRYPADFLGAIARAPGGLSAEEIGLLAVVIDLIYHHAAPVPNDPRWLGGLVRVSTRRASQLIASLIARDMLFEVGGNLSNIRAEVELRNAAKAHNNRVLGGSKGGRQRAKNSLEKRAKNSGKFPENELDTSNSSHLGQGQLKHRARDTQKVSPPLPPSAGVDGPQGARSEGGRAEPLVGSPALVRSLARGGRRR